MKQLKIIVKKHRDGYVAYPVGLKGVVVGEGNTREAALADVKSAIRFHLETFGKSAEEEELECIRAFDAAMASKEKPIPFEEAVARIEKKKK